MSASKDKKRRAEALANAEASKSETDKKKISSSKKYRNIGICVAVIFVLLTAFVLVFNSNLFFNKSAALKIGNGEKETKYTVADFNYYYVNQYNSYYSNASDAYGDYVSYFTPSTSTSLRNQEYDVTSGETWAEYFEKSALDTMLQVTALYDDAVENGFTLTDEDKSTIENEMYNLFLYGYTYYGYKDTDSFLEYYYGKGMDSDIYKKNLEKSIIANNYAQYILDSFEYSEEALDSYYDENADSFDYYEYRIFNINASEKDSETAMAEAKKIADEFVSKITDEQSFIDLAYEYASNEDKSTYEDEQATYYSYAKSGLPDLYSEWLIDSSRKTGDVTIVEGTDKYIVVFWLNRDTNDYNTINGSYFLIAPESVSEDDYTSDTAYNTAVENAKSEALSLAESILEESADTDFETLYNNHSSTITDHATVEKVGKHSISSDVADWFFSSDHKEGDSEIVYIEDSGYYILFFNGYDDIASRVMADNEMRNNDYESYVTDLTDAYSTTQTWLMRLTKKMASLGS